MKNIKKLPARFIGILTGIVMLFALSVPAFAVDTSSLTVKAENENQEPLAGVVFKLIGIDDSEGMSIGPVTTGDDGLASFDNLPENGMFELTEIGAPEGYYFYPHSEKSKFKIENNSVFLEKAFNEYVAYNDEELVVYQNEHSETLNFSLPIVIKTKQTGEKVPGKASFKVKMSALGDINVAYEDVMFVKVLTDRIDTDGVGEFRGVLKFSIPAGLMDGNDGFSISEVDEGADGWTYSTAVYNVSFAGASDGSEESSGFEITPAIYDDNNEPVYEPVENVIFENSYNKANDPTPPAETPTSVQPTDKSKENNKKTEIPKAGDKGVLPFCTVLFASICVAGISLALKKKYS